MKLVARNEGTLNLTHTEETELYEGLQKFNEIFLSL